ncbi:MAG: hypothetical protein ACN6O3_10005 [Comamonas sp.]
MSSPIHQEPLSQAARMLADAPQLVDRTNWYEQHEALCHHLLHTVAKAMITHTDEALREAGQAHGAVRRHAQLIAGAAVPIVLTRDGRHTIAYEQLAEARAKVTILQEELQAARAAASNAKALLAEVASCLTRDQNPPDDLRQRIHDWLISNPEITSQAVAAIASGEAFDIRRIVHELTDQEFTAGRQAMRAEIVAMLKRDLAQMASAAKQHPGMAELDHAASALEVARKSIEELHP